MQQEHKNTQYKETRPAEINDLSHDLSVANFDD